MYTACSSPVSFWQLTKSRLSCRRTQPSTTVGQVDLANHASTKWTQGKVWIPDHLQLKLQPFNWTLANVYLASQLKGTDYEHTVPREWATLHPLHILLHTASLQPRMLTMSSTSLSFQESPKFCFHCHLSLESHHWLRNSTKTGLISVGKIQGTSKTLALSQDLFPGCLGPHSICVLLEKTVRRTADYRLILFSPDSLHIS